MIRPSWRTTMRSPICDLLHRRLQPFCYLHDCSGCFRLERLPGGACTHWKAPPCHGAHVKRTLRIALCMSQLGGDRSSLGSHGIETREPSNDEPLPQEMRAVIIGEWSRSDC